MFATLLSVGLALLILLVVKAWATCVITITTVVTEDGGGAGITTTNSITKTTDAVVSVTVTAPANTADTRVNVNWNDDDLEWITIDTDKALTCEVNASSSAAQSISLAAGVTYEWHKNSGIKYPFRATADDAALDVTALYLTNALAAGSENNATVRIRYGRDLTP